MSVIRHTVLQTYHAAIISVEVLYNFLRMLFPEKNVAAVAAADNKFAIKAVKVDSFHCSHTHTTEHLALQCIQLTTYC